jgi:hypothetical protein
MMKLLPALALFACLTATAQSPRLSVYEEFTGENCPPCAATNPGLNNILSAAINTPQVVAIKWEVPIPSAPTKTWSLYQTNKAEIGFRASYYGISYAPEGRMDGQKTTVFGAASDHAGDIDDNVIATAASYTSPFSISIQRAWNISCTAVNLTITVNCTADFNTTGNLLFRTVMVERLIQFSVAPGTNGEKTFKDAAVKSFPTLAGGVSLKKNWTNGQSHTFTLSCEVPSYIRKKSEIAFVGMIQDDGNKKILQGARVGIDVVPVEAISQLDAKAENLVCGGSITPTVTISNEGPAAISQLTIVPYDGTVAGPITTWNGNLATGNSTTIVLNSLPVSTLAGTHLFNYDVVLTVPHYNLLGTRKMSAFMAVTGYQPLDVAEGFVTNTFPPAKWGYLNSNAGPGWSKTFATGGFNRSSDAAKYDFYTNTAVGDVDELYLPPADLSAPDAPTLSFDMAYAVRNGRQDQLEILVSDDCGQNWSSVFKNAGFALSTIPNEVNDNAYSPDPFDSTHWTTHKITLNGFNKPDVLVKFVTTNDNGNNLYLDNINLTIWKDVGLSKNALDMSVTLFPNPSHGETLLSIESQKSGNLEVTVVNALGQVVYSSEMSLQAGKNEITLNTVLPSGIYNVSLQNNQSALSKKLMIIK